MRSEVEQTFPLSVPMRVLWKESDGDNWNGFKVRTMRLGGGLRAMELSFAGHCLAYEQRGEAFVSIEHLRQGGTLKTFPIHSTDRMNVVNCPQWIPFEKIEPHREQAMRNHSQTLERLAERGGLGLDELYAVMHDRDYFYLFRGQEKPSPEECLRFALSLLPPARVEASASAARSIPVVRLAEAHRQAEVFTDVEFAIGDDPERAQTDLVIAGVPVVSNTGIAPSALVVLDEGSQPEEMNLTGGLELQAHPLLIEKLRAGAHLAEAEELIAAFRERR